MKENEEMITFSFYEEEEDSDYELNENIRKRELLNQSNLSFYPYIHNSEWFFKENPKEKTPEFSLLLVKAKWDRFYFLKQYQVILNDMDNYLFNIIHEDQQLAMFTKRELLQTWIKSLAKLAGQYRGIELLNKLDYFLDALYKEESWHRLNSIKAKASFDLFVWEHRARILLYSSLLEENSVSRLNSIKEAAHLLQKSIHCHVSLPLFNTVYQLSKEEKNIDNGNSIVHNFLASLHLSQARSHTLWSLLSQCYHEIGLGNAYIASKKHEQFLRDQSHYDLNHIDNPAIVLLPDDRYFIEFQVQEKDIFDKQFVDVYLKKEANIYQIIHSQGEKH
jgi:hypothetical protein